MIPSSRVVSIARATPLLRGRLARGLSSTPISLAGGKRTPPSQFAPRSSNARSVPNDRSSSPPNRTPTSRRRLSPVSSFLPSSLPTSKRQQVPSRPFEDSPLHPALLSTLSRFLPMDAKPTPIQTLSLDHFLSPKYTSSPRINELPLGAVLAAETGSGKTLAYMLPLLHHLKRTDPYLSQPSPTPTSNAGGDKALLPRAVVISPTHELTRQSTGVAKAFSHDIKLSIIGASDIAGRVRRSGNVDVLLSTGGTLRKMLGVPRHTDKPSPLQSERDDGPVDEDEEEDIFRSPLRSKGAHNQLDLSMVEWIVIDEADVLLGPDFSEETLHTLSLVPPRANLILVSATLPPSLTSLLASSSPSSALSSRFHWTRIVSPGLHHLPSSLSTQFVTSSSGNLFADVSKQVRQCLAEDTLKGDQRAGVLVFANTDRKVNGLVEALNAKGIKALGWTGEGMHRTPGSQGALSAFLTSHKPSSSSLPTTPASASASATPPPPPPPPPPRVLVTTSLLSRGLDFSNINTVILLDPPRDTLDFVHRAGRAGRAGRKGRVIVFGLGDFKGLGGRGGVGKGIKEVVRKPSKRLASGFGIRDAGNVGGNRQQPIRTQFAGGRRGV